MKNVMGLALLGLMVSVGSASADPLPKPELTAWAPRAIFTPMGFDDNDNAQVVVAGVLPNTCHKVAPSVVTVDSKKRKITIEDRAYVYSTSWCAMVTIPYTKTIELGLVKPGKYTVEAVVAPGKTKSMGTLPIGSATTASPDEYLYAPVSDALLAEKNESVVELVLQGEYSSPCMRMKEVRVVHNASNVLEILPIAEMMSAEACSAPNDGRAQIIPFEERVVIKDKLPRGPILIHVRSLNGQSLNRVIEN